MIQGVNLCLEHEHEHEHEHDHDDDDFGAGGMDWDDCFAILMEDRITTILDLPYRCLYCSTTGKTIMMVSDNLVYTDVHHCIIV